MNKDLPKVKIDKVHLIDNYFRDRNGNVWSSLKLIEQSKKYKEFDLPLIGVNLSRNSWSIENLSDFIHHVDRMKHTDLIEEMPPKDRQENNE